MSGLEDVVAFDTAIAEPDREGGALRYRGVDLEHLVAAALSAAVGALSGPLHGGAPARELRMLE